jgi:hypothetical protein
MWKRERSVDPISQDYLQPSYTRAHDLTWSLLSDKPGGELFVLGSASILSGLTFNPRTSDVLPRGNEK